MFYAAAQQERGRGSSGPLVLGLILMLLFLTLQTDWGPPNGHAQQTHQAQAVKLTNADKLREEVRDKVGMAMCVCVGGGHLLLAAAMPNPTCAPPEHACMQAHALPFAATPCVLHSCSTK